MVRGWLAAGKTTTAMATLRPDWPKSSIKKLVARLKAAVCTLASDPSERCPVTRWTSSGPNYPHCLGCLLPLSQKTWDLLFHSVASAAQHIEGKPYKPIKAQRVSAATRLRRLAFCRCIRLRLGARFRVCKGPSLPTLNLKRGKVMRPSSLALKSQTQSDGKILREEKFSVVGVCLGRDLEDRAKTTSVESARIM